MARTHARILTRIWHDDDFLALSSGAQRMYILALTQDTLTLCGVTLWTPKRWGRLAANTSPGTVEKDVAELVDTGFVVIDDDSEELWVRSFLKWDGVLDVPNIIKAMTQDFDAVRSGRIRAGIVEYFTSSFPGGFSSWLCDRYPNAFPKGMRGLSKGFLEAIGEPLAEGFLTRAPAQPSPVPVSEAETSPRRRRSAPSEAHGPRPLDGARDAVELTKRLADLCTATNRSQVNNEAAAVTCWALEKLDRRIVDEALAWTANTEQRPTFPRAVAKVIEAKAADNGIAITPFSPHVALVGT